MSFVTTHPEALAAAAGNLQTLDAALNAQNVAAAGSTTALAPAAADEVSLLQATQFSAYGALYQQISAQAAVMQEMFVNVLRASAGSYGETETANSAAATMTSGIGTATGLAGVGSGLADPTYGLGGVVSNSAILAAMNAANLASSTSAFTSLGTGFITNPSGVIHHTQGTNVGNLVSQDAPAAAGAPGAAAASAGQGSEAGKTAARPNWAGEAEPEAEARSLAAAESTEAAPRGATTVPAGIPAAGSSDRGPGFGRPRYGVKPVVMPRKPLV